MTQVSYQGGQYTETVDIKGVITLTPINNVEQELTKLGIHNSIVFRFKRDHSRKYMFIKRTNGNFIWLYKLSCDNKFFLNCAVNRELDNISIKELGNWIDFSTLEVDKA